MTYEEYLAYIEDNPSDPFSEGNLDIGFLTDEEEVGEDEALPEAAATTAPSVPTIDVTSGSTITFFPDPDNYGKDGWAYTKSGSIRTQIPEGWEIANALNDTSIGIRSAATGGDTIQVYIREYSKSLKDKNLENTPKNQFTLQNNEQNLLTDRWGNADFCYSMTEWSDYTSMLGYAAFDADKYVYFDIRDLHANGTYDQFMQSAAWKTFTDSFMVEP